MKKQFHIAYTSKGKQYVRVEFATNRLTALEQAKKHFEMFGYGDETYINSPLGKQVESALLTAKENE